MPLAVGIDLGGTNIRVALVTKQGIIVDRLRVSTRATGQNTNLIARISDTVNKLVNAHEDQRHNIIGVGLGIPGTIEWNTGIITQSPNIPEWVDYPLMHQLSPLLTFPLTIENDANAAALGELTFGAARGLENICCLTLGTGVGGGVIVNGKILHGTDGMAGEIGHMTVFPNGPVCNCGNQGCLEALASATAIKRMVMEFIATTPNPGFDYRDMLSIARDEGNKSIAQLVAEDLQLQFVPLLIAFIGRRGNRIGTTSPGNPVL